MSSSNNLREFFQRLDLIKATNYNPVPIEVTPLLKLACNDLGNGELIHGDDFDISATISALKDLDLKLRPEFVSLNYYVDEAIKNGAAPVPLSSDRTSDIRRVIDVMDHLLTCEATWHEGASFRETIYSCIYLQRLDRLSSHALLHSFCRSIAVTCRAIFLVFSSARTDDEVLRSSYYRSSKSDGDDNFLPTLQSIEETIFRKLKACTASSSKKKDLLDIEPLQTSSNLEEDFCKAVLCRLRFRKHFYHVLTNMRRTEGKGLEMAKKHIDLCLVELGSMLKSEEFLKSLCEVLEDSLSEHKTTASGCQPVGFDSPINITPVAPTAINRAYAALTRTRAVQLLSWKKAVSYFQKLLNDLSIICSNSLCPVLKDAVHFVVDFRKFQPGCVARGHIQLLLVQDGKLYGREPIFATICKAALLPETAKGHYIRNHETVAEIEKLVTLLLKVLCTSNAVQRRSLAKTLVDWQQILFQLHTEFGDLTSPPNDENKLVAEIWSSIIEWVHMQKEWITLRFVLLGFDLELYTPSEYCMVYCYISILLMRLQIRSRTLMGNKDVKFIECYIELVMGLLTMLVLLRNDHKAFQCVGPFNSDEERFIQHFKPIHEADSYREMYYSDFVTIYKKNLSNLKTSDGQQHFKKAQEIVRKLRAGFDKDPNRLAELNRIHQVAKRNSVVLKQIRKLRTPAPYLKVTFEFAHHPHFAVLSLQMS